MRAWLLLVLLLPLAAGAPAEIEERESRLPTYRVEGDAAALGGNVYYAGGQAPGVFHDDIIEYNPSDEVLRVLPATLPTPRSGLAAVSDGQAIYFFGGFNAGTYMDEIVRFDGTSVEVLDVRLPRADAFWSAVWADDRAYIFGGENCESRDEPACPVLEFIPAPDGGSIKELAAEFPLGIRGAAAVWTGDTAYLYGGRTPHGGEAYFSYIHWFTPEAGVGVVDFLLPEERHNAVATWHDGKAYVFGGNNVSGVAGARATIFVHDPAEGSLALHDLELPEESSALAAAQVGDDTFLLGGSYFWDRIYRFRPETPDGGGATGGGDDGQDEPATGANSGSSTTSSPPDDAQEGTQTTTTSSPAMQTCERDPHHVEAHRDGLGRTSVSWEADAACPAPFYVVWGGGRQLGIQAGQEGKGDYGIRVQDPGPGEHVFHVQAVDASWAAFDAEEAVASPPLVVSLDAADEGPAPVDVEQDAGTVPAPGRDPRAAVFGGLAVLAAAVAVLVLVAVRRARR